MKRGKRNLVGELLEGVSSMRARREGKITLRSHAVSPKPLPALSPRLIRETRERLNVSRGVFAALLRTNVRTLERWEQGRSRPNDQAIALFLLVRRYPETLLHLESLSA